MNNIIINTDNLRSFLCEEELTAMHKEVLAAKHTLMSGDGAGQDFLGWLDLPKDVQASEISSIKKDVERLAGKA